MGMIINGTWSDTNQVMEDGSYNRPSTSFRKTVLITDKQGDLASGRYILFISLSCPWCHRLVLVHQLKKLGNLLPLHIAGEPRLEGYALAGGKNCEISGLKSPAIFLHELYSASAPTFTGRSSIPILWDNFLGEVVNNESSDILRMMNNIAAPDLEDPIDLYPAQFRKDIDQWNDLLYHGLNNAVYETGFAQTQAIYEKSVAKVFKTLDQLEDHLGTRSYMVGDTLTETDCRVYPTLVRFDPVYHNHFKCSLKRIADYPNISRYIKRLNETHDFEETFDAEVTRYAYFFNDRSINPHGIVPLA